MKLKNNFELRNICGENVLVPCGKDGINLDCIIHLNETGAFLWSEAQKGEFDVDSLVDTLLNEYEVSRSVAQNDVRDFVSKLVEQNIATL